MSDHQQRRPGRGSRAGNVRHWWRSIRTSFWFVPTLSIVGATIAALALILADRALTDVGRRWVYTGGPESATATLTTIASSMVTFTGLVFSILIVALQLTSSQFSPRALRSFLRDRLPQAALGIFVATFTYAFTALAAVRYATVSDDGFVPSVTVTFALVLLGVSVLFFVQLIHHTAQSLRVVSIIDRIAGETRRAIADEYPEDGEELRAPAAGSSAFEVASDRAGVLDDADLEALAGDARELGSVIEVVPRAGDFVCRGETLLRVHGGETGPGGADLDEQALRRRVTIAREPTIAAGVGFGIRQLVDIAERALSPGINDPTTAVQCLDHLHDVLRDLTTRPVSAVRVSRVDHQVRAWQPGPSYGDLVHLAFDEVRHWGASSLQIHRRLAGILDDLLAVNQRPDRHLDLLEQRRLLLARRADLPEVELAVLRD